MSTTIKYRRTHRRQLTPHNVAELCQINTVQPQPLQVPTMTTTTVMTNDHSASLAAFSFPRRRPLVVTRPRRDSCSEQAVAAAHRMRLNVAVSHVSAATPRRGSLLVAPCV
jgi:hypothetical protein